MPCLDVEALSDDALEAKYREVYGDIKRVIRNASSEAAWSIDGSGIPVNRNYLEAALYGLIEEGSCLDF